MPKGSVLVVGGGIAGVQAALDLADSGFLVHLVEKTTAIGGRMSQLDKTFPTNDCSACILSPKLVECGRHLNINLLTLADLVSLEGEPGNFKAVVHQRPRYVDPTKCIACGLCAEKCPKKVDNEYNLGIGKRKAAYLSFPQAVPLKYAIDPDHCIWLKKPGRCGACAKVCPAGAINFDDQPVDHELEVGSVVLALGFSPYDPSSLDFTGYGRLANVITTMEFERYLSPSGPCMGHMERPSDGKEPKRVAWLQCVGSRDINRSCHPYCSSVCCMFAIKQAVIAKEHAHGEFAPSIFFMDMRTHGKGFEEYYNRAQENGVAFHRARVHSILPANDNDNLRLRYVDEQGDIEFAEFDMVILSTGLEVDKNTIKLAEKLNLELDEDNFVKTDIFNPVATSRPGVFVCGAVAEPKDIPQSVMEASAAAMEAGCILAPARWSDTAVKEYPPERDIHAEAPRIGVFVCHCGINIAGVVDVKAVTEYAATLPDVVFSQDNLFTCSQDTIDQMVQTIREQNLNRVVVASCSPRTHEPLFQQTLRDAGLNKYVFEMANIRDQDSWVHKNEPEAATGKAMDLVRMATARVRGEGALPYHSVKVNKSALVIGGGIGGMTAALSLAEQNFPVTLVEKSNELGGNANNLYRTWQDDKIQPYVAETIKKVNDHPNIDLELDCEVGDTAGSVGKFTTTLDNGKNLEHGVAVVAVGGRAYTPAGEWRFLYGQNDNVHTLLEIDRLLIEEKSDFKSVNQAVFIHCVGSRIPERPWCSRVCCTHAIDQAVKLKEMNPDMDIFMLYRDIRTYGRRELLYQKARALGIIFVRYDLDHIPAVNDRGGQLVVTTYDPIVDAEITLNPDLLVLATAIEPADSGSSVARFFKCAIDAHGFLLEAHMKLRPVDFATDGVYLAGLCHYPKPIEETIAQAKAAAARATIVLSQDEVPAESITALVNPAKCVGCGVCVEVCAYNAVSMDEDKNISVVNSDLCKGCGACVAGCRSDALTLQNIGNEQIMAAVDAAFA